MMKNIFEICQNVINSKNNGGTVIIPHICDNICNFNTEFERRLISIYPEVKINYELNGKLTLGSCKFLSVAKGYADQELIVASLIAKKKYKNVNRKIYFPALLQCLLSVKNYAKIIFDTKSPKTLQIHLTKKNINSSNSENQFVYFLAEDVYMNSGIDLYYY